MQGVYVEKGRKDMVGHGKEDSGCGINDLG